MTRYAYNPYVKYYEDQAGHGVNVFRGTSYQRGHGIGQFFGGLLRTVMPLIKSGARAIGRQVLTSGASLLGDVVAKKPFKQSFRERVAEAGESLKRKAESKVQQLVGEGLKQPRIRRQSHSASVLRRRKTSQLKKKRDQKARRKQKKKGNSALDIFS